MKKRKVPQRMCISCREQKDKKELIRMVKTPDNEFMIDTTGKKPGRGAYICKNKSCLDMLKKKNLIKKHLGVELNPDAYQELEKVINENV